MRLYKCDNENCQNKTSDIKSDGWVEIGSLNHKSLRIENYLSKGNLISMDNHSDIHFCSAACLVERFTSTITFKNVEKQ